jgi:hypothetical protein
MMFENGNVLARMVTNDCAAHPPRRRRFRAPDRARALPPTRTIRSSV